MILGNAAWGFRETPLERQLQITADMGLSLLELSIAGHKNNELQRKPSASEIKKVAALFKKYKVDLTCAATGNDFTQADPEKCRADLEAVLDVLDTASKLGVQKLRIFAGFSPYKDVDEKRWSVMTGMIKRAADHARKRNVTLAVETHGGVEGFEKGVKHFHSVSTHHGELARLLHETPEDVGLNFDPANLWAVGIKEPETLYEEFKSRICYAHLKDFTPVPETDLIKPAACGEGPMDWKALAKAMSDYSGPGLIEYEIPADAEHGFRRSLKFLKTVFVE
jgi:sugar phosphate isomerase/epimerase